MQDAVLPELTQINTRCSAQANNIVVIAWRWAICQLTSEEPVKAYRRMCTIRKFGKLECVHKESTSGQVLGFVDSCASMHRAHGHLIGKGAES